jgi:hypothetical protein
LGGEERFQLAGPAIAGENQVCRRPVLITDYSPSRVLERGCSLRPAETECIHEHDHDPEYVPASIPMALGHRHSLIGA